MGTYKLTIRRTDDAIDEPTLTTIEVETRYNLTDSLIEWFTTEYDGVTINTMPGCCTQIVLTPGRHSTRCLKMCSECINGNHDACIDGGLSAVPFECTCAMRRHES